MRTGFQGSHIPKQVGEKGLPKSPTFLVAHVCTVLTPSGISLHDDLKESTYSLVFENVKIIVELFVVKIWQMYEQKNILFFLQQCVYSSV